MTQTHGKSSTIRTEWFDGPMKKAFAEGLVEAITTTFPPKCGSGSGDRREGVFVTRHDGILTVGIRGCSEYRLRVIQAFGPSEVQAPTADQRDRQEQDDIEAMVAANQDCSNCGHAGSEHEATPKAGGHFCWKCERIDGGRNRYHQFAPVREHRDGCSEQHDATNWCRPAVTAPFEVEVLANDVLNPGFGYSVVIRDAKGNERKVQIGQVVADQIMAAVVKEAW